MGYLTTACEVPQTADNPVCNFEAIMKLFASMCIVFVYVASTAATLMNSTDDIDSMSLGTAFFEDPRPTKYFAVAMKEFIVGGALRVYRSKTAGITDGIKSFSLVAIQTGNAVYGKLQKILAALEETKPCGYFTKSCPETNQAWENMLKSAVE